jgi:acyl-CoA thioester hydrolase
MTETLAPYSATVRPEWVDYNGHMNEAYYVLIFGDATDAFYDHIGLDAAYREREKVSAYTMESHIRYLAETHQGDALHVHTRVLAHDAKRVRLHHSMWRTSDSKLVAVIELIVLHVDKTTLGAKPFHAAQMKSIARITEAQSTMAPPQPSVSTHWAHAILAKNA